MKCIHEVQVKPDEEFNALCKNAVRGSEDPNDLVVLAFPNATADKCVSFLFEEIVCMRCYDYKSRQYVVFEVKLTQAASREAKRQTVWSTYVGLTSNRASFLKLLEFVQLSPVKGLVKMIFRAVSGSRPRPAMIKDIQDDRLSTDAGLFFIDPAKTFISHCFLEKRTDIHDSDRLHEPYQVIYNEFQKLYNRDKQLRRSKSEPKNGLARKDVASYAEEIG